jgi:integrase
MDQLQFTSQSSVQLGFSESGPLVEGGEQVASITKRNGAYRVRWRDPDGKQKSQKCPNRKAAQALVREVEGNLALGRFGKPAELRRVPDIEEILKAFLVDSARRHKPNSTRRHANDLTLFLRWVKETYSGVPSAALLSKRMLADFYDHLVSEKRNGRRRKASTAKKTVCTVQLVWKWADDDEEYCDLIPRPRELKMPSEPRPQTVAPTWAEMDACIAQCDGALRKLAITLRFTGLRVQQAMELRWSDFDMEEGTLTVRGELGKTLQEQSGRIVPVSRHLLDEMAGWGRQRGFLIPTTRRDNGPRTRTARSRDMHRAWKRSGVREEVYRQRPHHAFRKGFVSGLVRLGADREAVEYLVGHSLALRGIYVDPTALPLRVAVGRIPVVGEVGVVVAFGRSEEDASEL